MLTINQLNNLRAAAKQAYQCELHTKVPCELILSQWALESGWGAHAPENNCFGIKGDTRTGQLLHTTEYFKSYGDSQTWAGAKQGRVADLADATYKENGTQRYAVQDWFASFPTLGDCFIKRATLFQKDPYWTATIQYLKDQNLVAFIQRIAPIYATDPDYSQRVLAIASLPEVQAAIKEVRNAPVV